MQPKSAPLGNNKLTPKQKAFLAAYRRSGHIGQAAETVKINWQSHPVIWLAHSAGAIRSFAN